MARIREILAEGGMATLAALFAIAVAIVGLANAISQVVIGAIEQHTADPDRGGSGLDFRLFSTDFDLIAVVQAGVALLFVAALLWGVWRLARTQECPECRSEVPEQARVCRYCTADLPVSPEW